MGYYLYPLSCDSDDTGEENTLEQLNLEQEMLSCKTKCFFVYLLESEIEF